jgi:hypothetical protein
MMPEGRTRRIEPKTLLAILALMAGEWILLVAGVRKDEMIVGAVAVSFAAAFLCLILRSQKIELNFTIRDAFTVWRVPWYILSNTFTLCCVLMRDFLEVRHAGSYYRVSGFKTSKTDPTLVARRVLATVYTSVSPNSIVIGIDYDQNRLLLHQVIRDDVSKMTKELGGQP